MKIEIRTNCLNKELYLDDEFEAGWEGIVDDMTVIIPYALDVAVEKGGKMAQIEITKSLAVVNCGNCLDHQCTEQGKCKVPEHCNLHISHTEAQKQPALNNQVDSVVGNEPIPGTRKVVVYEWPKVKGQAKVAVGHGIFHQFGCDYEEFESGPGNYTTAIVEMSDGSVRNVPVDMVVFNN